MAFSKNNILCLITIIFVLIICPRCRKKNNGQQEPPPKLFDTVKPKSYFPVYPGSWWIYLDQKNDTVKHYTLDTYQKNCFAPGFVDTALVPIYFTITKGYLPYFYNMKSEFPVYGYDLISEFRPFSYSMQNYRRVPFLSEVKGTVLKIGGMDSRYGDHRPESQMKDKLVINGDSVIVVQTIYYGQTIQDIEHYTKNKGLTFRLTVDTLKHDTLTLLRLVKYRINR